jgi:hypothetical protein
LPQTGLSVTSIRKSSLPPGTKLIYATPYSTPVFEIPYCQRILFGQECKKAMDDNQPCIQDVLPSECTSCSICQRNCSCGTILYLGYDFVDNHAHHIGHSVWDSLIRKAADTSGIATQGRGLFTEVGSDTLSAPVDSGKCQAACKDGGFVPLSSGVPIPPRVTRPVSGPPSRPAQAPTQAPAPFRPIPPVSAPGYPQPAPVYPQPYPPQPWAAQPYPAQPQPSPNAISYPVQPSTNGIGQVQPYQPWNLRPPEYPVGPPAPAVNGYGQIQPYQAYPPAVAPAPLQQAPRPSSQPYPPINQASNGYPLIPQQPQQRGFTISHPDGRTWKNKADTLRLNSGSTIRIEIYAGSDVYNSQAGRVALFENGDRNRAVRHMGFVLYTHKFEKNNFDFAWRLVKSGSGIQLFNDYGNGHWVGYDSKLDVILLVQPDDARRVTWTFDPFPSMQYVKIPQETTSDTVVSRYYSKCNPNELPADTQFTVCMFRSDVGLTSIPNIPAADQGNNRLHYVGRGKAPSINFNSFEQFRSVVSGIPSADYAWAISGQLMITNAGSYTLCITSDDG